MVLPLRQSKPWLQAEAETRSRLEVERLAHDSQAVCIAAQNEVPRHFIGKQGRDVEHPVRAEAAISA
jgi:hypothetical protein